MTEVGRLGKDRSSMEALLLTCFQAQLLINRVNTYPNLTPKIRNDIIWEIRQVTKKDCKINQEGT